MCQMLLVVSVSVMCISAAASGILIVALIRLRQDVASFESMVIWKWTEAPWWTRSDSDFHAAIASHIRNRESHFCCCRCMAGQSGVTTKENDFDTDGSI